MSLTYAQLTTVLLHPAVAIRLLRNMQKLDPLMLDEPFEQHIRRSPVGFTYRRQMYLIHMLIGHDLAEPYEGVDFWEDVYIIYKVGMTVHWDICEIFEKYELELYDDYPH